MNAPADLGQNAVVHILACMSVNPQLSGLLLVDAAPETVDDVTAQLRELVALCTGSLPHVLSISPSDTDGALFGSHVLTLANDRLDLVWSRGRLVQQPDDPLAIVQIHDLSELSPLALRASLSVLGADVAHIEREGVSRWWTPRLLWVIADRTPQLASVSSHFLDRITLRMRIPASRRTAPLKQVAALRARLHSAAIKHPALDLSPAARAWMKDAANLHPALTKEALNYGQRRFEELHPHDGLMRRYITYMQMAVAIAQLDHATEVTTAHIDRVNAMLMQASPDVSASPSTSPASTDAPLPANPSAISHPRRLRKGIQSNKLPLVGPGEGDEAPDISIDPHGTFAGQSTGSDAHEAHATSLLSDRLMLPRADLPRHESLLGPAYGTTPARDFSDISLFDTLVAAVIHAQAEIDSVSSALRVRPEDFRQYLRMRVPNPRLVLVIDFTAAKHVDLDAILSDTLQEAYRRRAEVHFIGVGVQRTNPLQAHHASFRSPLSPRLRDAMHAQASSATPLAHGLYLAYKVMRGDTAAERAARDDLLMLFTDGRGNIPLAESRSAATTISYPVGALGFEDALAEASRIRRLTGVESMVLTPLLEYLPHLPVHIAERLRAPVFQISVAHPVG